MADKARKSVDSPVTEKKDESCPTCGRGSETDKSPGPSCTKCQDRGYILEVNGNTEQLAWILTVCNNQESCRAARKTPPKQVTFAWPSRWQPKCDVEESAKEGSWKTDESKAEGEK